MPMPIQITAHGFDLSEAIKESCTVEALEKLTPLAQHQFQSKWTLSLEAGSHVTHLMWKDGPFQGDVTVKSGDMYDSIHQATKKACEQMKKAHSKRNHHHHEKPPFVEEPTH